jgi:hypothetical protein
MMFNTDTLWFDTAVVLAIFAVGNIYFGHFEAHRPRWARIAKMVVVLSAVLGLAATAGRVWSMGLIGLLLLGGALIHLVWLPRNGVNGWTGEPRDRYYELIGHKPQEGGAGRLRPAGGNRRVWGVERRRRGV